MKPRELKVGEIVQISPKAHGRGGDHLHLCLLVVTEPKPWGAEGYVVTGESVEPYSPGWDDMEPTGGMAVWVMDVPREVEPL